jgi:hypothetical protein
VLARNPLRVVERERAGLRRDDLHRPEELARRFGRVHREPDRLRAAPPLRERASAQRQREREGAEKLCESLFHGLLR